MNGVINVYKPSGITSFDVVKNIKKISGEKKVGHTGTLDPLAEGVLPICLGKATKLVDFIMLGKKVYQAEMKLGEITDTYDREGKIIKTAPVEADEVEISKAIMSFKGDILQVPPMYSALKVNGKKLYELARSGIEVEREARKISIYNVNIKSINIPFVVFDVECSKGTYIRSLCYDIGQKLGCGAVMYHLTRCASGIFNIENSVKLEKLNKENIFENIISLDECLSNYPLLKVNEKFEKLLINGVSIQDRKIIDMVEEEKLYKLQNSHNKLLGLGSLTEKGFKIVKLLT